jgi:ATP-dependent Lon protease
MAKKNTAKKYKSQRKNTDNNTPKKQLKPTIKGAKKRGVNLKGRSAVHKNEGAKPQRSTKSKKKISDSESYQSVTQPEEIAIPDVLPVLAAKDMVPFPGVMMSLYLSRAESISAMEAAINQERLAFIVAQSRGDVEDPRISDLYTFGVVAHIVRTLQVQDGRYKVLLQGLVRAKVKHYRSEDNGYITAEIDPIPQPKARKINAETQAIINRIRENIKVLVEYEHLPEEMLIVTEEIQDPGTLADVILAHYKVEVKEAQAALEEVDSVRRVKLTDSAISDDLNKFVLAEKIRDKARDEMTKGQREYYLREQIKQIQRELGEFDPTSDDLQGLRAKLAALNLPKVANDESLRQLKRLEQMSPESGEFALLRTYLEWIADLPWNERTKDKLDLARAKAILDEDHFGLDKVKDRILEYLSVRALNPDSKGPILCFVGPPGVGKTSLGQSIAKALGRKFNRMSLGGMRDEAEIRGHRRTYVGALPGRIVQGLKQAATRNPVFVLDELDKIGADFRGDPASALLEVLDPQQNKEFTDHYLNVPFDLSDVLFVATANTIDTIPEALIDRLEILWIPGYTSQEKQKIATRYIIPRQLRESGLDKQRLSFSNAAIELLVDRYTREAGVRSLEREVGAVCRKVAREYSETKRIKRIIDPARIAKLLGPTKYDPEVTDAKDAIGLVRGLAWTTQGGEVMPIEVSLAKGSGVLALTGQLGNIMQESAQAALFYARANASVLGLDPDFHSKHDIHIHVPGGATPKDGPSAGIAIATALVSALSGRRVSKDVAMTGEMTLRGNVLAVGGLREKALAALQYGINKVIIPFENIKDLEEIPEEQRKKIQLVPVKHVSEVLELSLLGQRKRIVSSDRRPKRGVLRGGRRIVA